MTIPELPVPFGMVNPNRLDSTGNRKLSVPEVLQGSAGQLEHIIRNAVDEGLAVKDVSAFVKKVAARDKDLARQAMKKFSEHAHVTPERLALLNEFKGTALYFKPSEMSPVGQRTDDQGSRRDP